MCLDIPLKRVEAFSEVVSEQVAEGVDPVYEYLLLLSLLLCALRNKLIVCLFRINDMLYS